MDLVVRFIDDSRESPETILSARKLLADAFEDAEHVDELLKRHCRHWGLTRLAMVDRGILRLAVHELRAEPVPPKVVITEALKLAREFSTGESPRFINGVLDSVMQELLNGSDGRDASGRAGTQDLAKG